MAEVGLLQFARVARTVAEAAVPAYRSRWSKHTFTQPRLLAILCLMRYENWTYRETEMRLQEHAELRATLGIERVPDYTTLYRSLRRTSKDDLTRLLQENDSPDASSASRGDDGRRRWDWPSPRRN